MADDDSGVLATEPDCCRSRRSGGLVWASMMHEYHKKGWGKRKGKGIMRAI